MANASLSVGARGDVPHKLLITMPSIFFGAVVRPTLDAALLRTSLLFNIDIVVNEKSRG